jgi:putative membrane protein
MIRFIHGLLQQGRLALGYPGASLVAVWLLTMISLPILRWGLGDDALQNGIVFGVLVQVAVVMAVLVQAWNWQAALRVALPVIGLAWLVEFIGSQSGFLFGEYDYTHVLQPQLGGVPLLIPLAWLMMLPPAWAVAERIAAGRRFAKITFVLVSALAFTAWDLFLDPQMVAWDFWRWVAPGGYFGIPWTNYLGWLVISGLMTVIVCPKNLPIIPLVAIYILTWLLQTIGQLFFWGLPGPAIVGFFGMGVFILLTLRSPNPLTS